MFALILPLLITVSFVIVLIQILDSNLDVFRGLSCRNLNAILSE